MLSPSSLACRLAWIPLIAAFAGVAPAAAEQNAAHALADKFSTAETKAREAERSKQADAERSKQADAERSQREEAERVRQEEADMLERARREAAERTQQQRDLEDAEARIRSLEAARAEEAKRLSEKLRRAEEARRLKSASETEKPFMPALSKPKAPAPPVVPPVRELARDPVRELAPDVARRLPPVAPAEAPRSVEAAEPFELPPVGPPPFEPPMALGRAGAPSADPVDPRVTVLLVMDPGTKGIRRFNKTADPVLCHEDVCYVSTGPAAPARALKRSKALGAGNTLGQRAGACRHSLTCVFRGVTLTGSAPIIQPVDLKVLVHDRRAPRSVSGDASCRAVGGRLSCSRTVVAPGYRAWIVPEAVAEGAGAKVLQAALARGLTAVDLREAAVRD